MIFVICACCQIIFSGYSHLLTPFESYFHCLFTDFGVLFYNIGLEVTSDFSC